MIEVRIRSEYAPKATHLMDWPADKLDDIVPLLAEWTTFVAGFDGDPVDVQGRFDCQFVVTDTAAYFEVIVHDEAAR